MNPTDYPPEALRFLALLSTALLGGCALLSLLMINEAVRPALSAWRRVEALALWLLFSLGAVTFTVITAALVGAL